MGLHPQERVQLQNDCKKLKYIYIDSGAMYRALTYYAIQKKYISKTHFVKIN